MKLPHQLLVKLSPLVEAARGEPLVEPFVKITEDNERSLVLTSSYGVFTFNKEERNVQRDSAESITFESVQSVDIGFFPGGRGARSWSIALYRGVLDRITVARTYDDGEASVLASKISRIVGRKVISLAGFK